MASEVDICNLALSRIGAYSITSLSASTTLATQCARHYATTRDVVLRDHAWGFAKKRKVLILIDDTYSGWDYAYIHPADCMVANKIYDETGALSGTIYDEETDSYVTVGRIEFEVSLAEDLAGDKVITAATVADPVVITSVAHGYTDGDHVILSGVVGMTELNGRTFIVDDKAADTFELTDSNGNDVDGTGYTAYVSDGVANKVNSDRKLILTDKEDAELIYTAQVTTTMLFDPMFVNALSLALAVNLAQPLKADKALKKELEREYEYAITRAKAISANESYEKPDKSGNAFVDAR